MQEITERLLTQRIADLEAAMVSQRAMIIALVFELGGGGQVSISRARQRQADAEVGELEARRLASGVLRFTPYPHEELSDG
jgi:hypothetical protein